MAIFLTGAALLFLLLAQHPFVTYPLSLLLLPRRRSLDPGPRKADAPRSVAVCMSAFNEERVIVDKMERLLEMAAAHGAATIHVYVDGAQDRTAELLAPYAGRADVVVSRERRGKTYGLNTLVARSQSELLAFTDTNVLTPVSGLRDMAGAFSDPSVGCVTAQLGYSNPDETGAALASDRYWKVEEAIKRLESETVGVVGVDGAFFMVRRDLYEPAPAHLIDDFYISLVVFASDRRVISLPAVRISERNASKAVEEVRRKARIACQAFNVQKALWPRLSRMHPLKLYAYLSHRTLKWLIPYTTTVAALLLWAASGMTLGWPVVLAATVAGGGVVLMGAAGGSKLFRSAVSALMSLYGVGLGVAQSVFGSKTYTTWAPAASIRDPST